MVKFSKVLYLGLGYYFAMKKLLLKIRRHWWLTKRVYKPLYLKLYLMFTILVNILLFAMAMWLHKRLSGELMVLHYNVDFGIDLVGKSLEIFLLPVFGAIVLIINFIFTIKTYNRKNFVFLSHLLPLSALTVNLLLILGFLSIYLINFR